MPLRQQLSVIWRKPLRGNYSSLLFLWVNNTLVLDFKLLPFHVLLNRLSPFSPQHSTPLSFQTRGLTHPGLPRTFPVLALWALHPGKPLCPGQTRTGGHPVPEAVTVVVLLWGALQVLPCNYAIFQGMITILTEWIKSSGHQSPWPELFWEKKKKKTGFLKYADHGLGSSVKVGRASRHLFMHKFI